MAHHADSSKSNQNPLRDARIGGIWRLGRKIGSGSFGDIYKGKVSVFHGGGARYVDLQCIVVE